MMLQECEVLLVLVGAGMGVDSGLSTFRAKESSTRPISSGMLKSKAKGQHI